MDVMAMAVWNGLDRNGKLANNHDVVNEKKLFPFRVSEGGRRNAGAWSWDCVVVVDRLVEAPFSSRQKYLVVVPAKTEK